MSRHAQRTEERVKILGELLVSIGIEDFYVGEDIECSRVCAISTSYPKHTHEEYIISANLKGIERIWVDNKDYVVPAGYVTVYNPMAIQSSQFCSDGVEFISLHINPETIKKVAIDNNIVHRDSYPLLQQGALKNEQIFRAIQECYSTARSSSEYKEESILWLLATLLEEDKPVTGRKRHSVNMAINNMKDCLDGKIDLSSLASSVGLSKYHFVRVFRQEVGIAPVQYHMQLRLIEARRMIRDGIKPIDVMADLGFYDQSHFINTFRKVMAMTPDLYSRSQEIKLS